MNETHASQPLRDALVQAVNGNPISADYAWALIHAWDERDAALREIVRIAEEKGPLQGRPYDMAKAARRALGLKVAG